MSVPRWEFPLVHPNKCKSMLLFAAAECIPYLQLILKEKYSFILLYPSINCSHLL